MADGLPTGLAREPSRGSGRTRPPGRVPAPSLGGACPVGEGPCPLGEGPCSLGEGPCSLWEGPCSLGEGPCSLGDGIVAGRLRWGPVTSGLGTADCPTCAQRRAGVDRAGAGWQGRKVLALVCLQHASGRVRCPLSTLSTLSTYRGPISTGPVSAPAQPPDRRAGRPGLPSSPLPAPATSGKATSPLIEAKLAPPA